MKATCRGCGTTFEADRLDAVFHDGACKARFWRLMGQTGQHEKLEKFTSKHCEHCGNLFWHNDYANRGGQRVPKYCRDACRVAAHRERTKATWTHEQAGGNSAKTGRVHQQKDRQAPPPPPNTGDFRDKLKPPSRWTELEAYLWLAVQPYSRETVCRAAWRKLNAQYHPDANTGQIWPHLAYVNAAYDYLKRSVWKRR